MIALALLAMTLTTGCRPRASSRGTGSDGERVAGLGVPAEGFAVLPWGTSVFLEPSVGGLSSRLGWPVVPPPPWPTPGTAVRVMGLRDGFVEIAPVEPDGTPHCGPVLDADAFDVRLYVSPWSLAPVLTRSLELVDAAGDVLALRPGAVVQRIPHDPEGRWAVSAAGILVRARVPDDAVGLVYEAPRPHGMPSARRWGVVPYEGWTHDGWPLELDEVFGGDVAIASVSPRDDGFRIEVVSACAKVTAQAVRMPQQWPDEPHFEFGLGGADVRVPDGATIEPPPPEPPRPLEPLQPLELSDGVLLGELDLLAEGPGRLPAVRPEWIFEEGAPVYLSPAGPAAGTLRELRLFAEDAWAAGDRLCFHTSFGMLFTPSLPVCMDEVEGRLRDPNEDAHDFQGPLVRPGSIRVTGAMTRAAVERALRVHRHELRRCAFEAQAQGRPPRGELAIALDVGSTGKVLHVRLRSPWVESMSDCAVAAVERWTLPASRDGKPAEVEFSVQLGPA